MCMHTGVALTSNEDGKWRLNERAAASDSHEGGKDTIGNLIGIESLITFVDLDQSGDDGLCEPPTGC